MKETSQAAVSMIALITLLGALWNIIPFGQSGGHHPVIGTLFAFILALVVIVVVGEE